MSVDADAPPPSHQPSPSPQNALALRPGALIHSRFRVNGTLGSSAYAFTYLAVDEQYRERVVVKEFFPRGLVTRAPDSPELRAHSSADDQEFARAAKRFLREGELLADLSHPALLRIRRAFEENGTAYVVADFLPVTPLREHVRTAGGRLLAAQAVEMCSRLLEGLELIHAEGGLHRDISPDTVGLDSYGRPILVGFPAARHLHGHGRDLTPGFAAIELYGAKGYGPWTDVYSCAALLYFMVTGVVPPSAVERAAGQSVTSPSSLIGGLSPAFVNAILRGLSQLPEQRTHSANEFQKQIIAGLHLGAQATAADISPLAVDRSPLGTPAQTPLLVPSDSNRALRLTTAGLVLPEEPSLGRRLIKWLTSGRQSLSHEAAAERARLADEAAAEILAQLNPLGIAGAPPAPDVGSESGVRVGGQSQAPESPPVRVPAPSHDDVRIVSRIEEDLPLPSIREDLARVIEAAAPVADAAPVDIPAARVDVPVAPTEMPVVESHGDDADVSHAPLAQAQPHDEPHLDPFDALIRDAELGVLPRRPEPDDVKPVADETPLEETFDTTSYRARALDADAFDTDVFDAYAAEETRRSSIFRNRSLPKFNLPPAITRRSRPAIALGIILILAGAAGGVAYAARLQSGRARTGTDGKALPNIATRQAGNALAAPKPTATDSAHGGRVEATSSGVLQHTTGAARQESTPVNRRTDPTTVANRPRTDTRESDAPAVPSLTNIQPLNVAIATQSGAPQLLPPELLIDIRDRLAAGRQFADGGDYQSARRALRGALTQIDSLSARFAVSDALRLLRRDAENEAQKTLDACLAENEIHKKRGGKVLACQ